MAEYSVGRNGSRVQGCRCDEAEPGGSGRFRREAERQGSGQAIGHNGVVATMAVAAAALAFFFHVRDFTARRQLAIATDDAAARQRGKPEKPNETHAPILRLSPEQILYR
jgi:hypothetical protein